MCVDSAAAVASSVSGVQAIQERLSLDASTAASSRAGLSLLFLTAPAVRENHLSHDARAGTIELISLVVRSSAASRPYADDADHCCTLPSTELFFSCCVETRILVEFVPFIHAHRMHRGTKIAAPFAIPMDTNSLCKLHP